jgi:hypothetical protein
MGSLGSVRIIKRPPPARIMFKNIQGEIVKQLQPVGRQHVNERKKIVSDFDHKPEFGYQIATTEKQITLTISVTNSGDAVSDDFTIGDLWKALDKTGTRAHDITPKQPGGVLRFQWGGPGSYNPHTRPIAHSGGAGTSSGPIVYRRHVRHPGFPPRKFSDSINKRLRPQFEKAISRGVSIGSRKR